MVMYLEKSMFRSIRVSRAKFRMPKGVSRYDSKNAVKVVKDPDIVMVWGMFLQQCRAWRTVFFA